MNRYVDQVGRIKETMITNDTGAKDKEELRARRMGRQSVSRKVELVGERMRARERERVPFGSVLLAWHFACFSAQRAAWLHVGSCSSALPLSLHDFGSAKQSTDHTAASCSASPPAHRPTSHPQSSRPPVASRPPTSSCFRWLARRHRLGLIQGLPCHIFF